MKISLIMHPMRRTLLVMVVVALQLAACGGNSNGDTITTTDSTSGLALSKAASTGSTAKVPSSIASAPSVTTAPSATTTPPAVTGSFKLNWTLPVARADGSPLLLSDIDGFHIYLGKKPGAYTSQINVANGAAQSTTVTNLAVGTYYLVMTTYDVSGRESGYSPVISKQAL
jgi:hypothetical protein